MIGPHARSATVTITPRETLFAWLRLEEEHCSAT
jgi:hypothetical protein